MIGVADVCYGECRDESKGARRGEGRRRKFVVSCREVRGAVEMCVAFWLTVSERKHGGRSRMRWQKELGMRAAGY